MKKRYLFIVNNNLDCKIQLLEIIKNCKEGSMSVIILPSKNTIKIRTLLSIPWQLVLLKIISEYLYRITSVYFKNSILDICKKNTINILRQKQLLKKQKGSYNIINLNNCLLNKNIVHKNRIINIHGAPLPNYKGICNYFWIVYENRKESFLTFHELNDIIDGGKILFFGTRISVAKNDSVFSVWLKSLLKTGPDFANFIKQKKTKTIKNNCSIKPRGFPDKKVLEKKVNYFSLIDLKTIIFHLAQ